MSDKLITVKIFYYDHETLLIEPMLQSAGIDYFLKDHQTVMVDPFLSNAIGGIKLQVRAEDVERTREILNEIDKNQEMSKQEQIIVVDGITFNKVFGECPKCGCEDIYMEELSGMKSITGMFSKNKFYCKDCKNQWKQHEER
jgi:hypothetical protein